MRHRLPHAVLLAGVLCAAAAMPRRRVYYVRVGETKVAIGGVLPCDEARHLMAFCRAQTPGLRIWMLQERR